tara:strand:+ start:236 stop:1423 length:1188 start_codon:yes stop_codon:yes gene_type:complete
MTTNVKNTDTIAELDALNDFDIVEVEEVDEVVPDVDTNVYPATDVVDLENEFNALKARIADGTATDEDMARFSALIIQRQAAKTGKSITEVANANKAAAQAIVTDELNGSMVVAMDAYTAALGGPPKMAERIADFNDWPFAYALQPDEDAGIYDGAYIDVPAGGSETATGKITVQWAETGKLSLASQRRHLANQLLLLDFVEEVIAKTGVIKGKLDGNVARDENGQIVIGKSTVTYEAKVSGGTSNVNRTGVSVSTKLPTDCTLWLADDYTVNVPGYGDLTLPAFSNVPSIRALFDGKKVRTGTFKPDNVLRSQGPFEALCKAFPAIGYHDPVLGHLPNSENKGGTSYDSTVQRMLMAVGVNDNFALAQRIIIKVDGKEDITIAEYDAKIKGSIK